jgi:hypothetical protein
LRKLAAAIIAQGQEGSSSFDHRVGPRRDSGALVETATVERPASVYAGLYARVRALPAEVVARWALVALTAAALVGFFVRVTYPNYDSYYSLVWGREIVHGHLPSFEAYRAPTEHPLAVAIGALLSVFGHSADRIFVLITILSFVALVAGIYRLGRLCFTPFIGALAAFLILTRFKFPSLAVRGYIDIPFMATVVWAGALEAARPRRGLAVFLLLAAAGLMRPEAWILSGIYFLWMSWKASWPDRMRYAALTALAPVGWIATDLIVTGKPFFSLNSTKALASELQRSQSGTGALSALPSGLKTTVKVPVFFTGLVGIAIAVWRYPTRSIVPLMLFAAGTFTFVATGLVGLSVITRYLLVPGVVMSLFAALALGGFTMLGAGSRARRAWAGTAGVVVVLGIVWTAFHPPSFVRFNDELVFRGESGRSLYALLGNPAVKRGLRCGPLSLPTHRVIPDARWILDLPVHRVVSRSQTAPGVRRRMQYGVAVIPTSRLNVVRNTYFTAPTLSRVALPPAGFERAVVDPYFAAYVRCPSS